MRQAVIGLVYHPKDPNAVLIVKRRDVPIWVLPGGGVDEGESPPDAIVREIFEETGIKTSIDRLAALYVPANRFSEITHVYQCTPLDEIEFDNHQFTSAESSAVCFAKLSDLPIPFFFIHQDWIKEIKNSPNSPVRRTLDEVNLWAILRYFLMHPFQVIRFIYSKYFANAQ